MTENPTVWKIDEPTTTLTDIALGILTLAIAVWLGKDAIAAERLDVWFWAIAFALTGATAGFGAYHHGFSRRTEGTAFRDSWRATQLLTGLTSYFLLAAPAVSLLDGWVLLAVIVAALFKALAYLLLIRRDTESFRTAAIDSGLSLIGLGIMAASALGGIHGEAALWMLGGVAIGLVGGVIQAVGIGIHRHFNHNDIFHLIHMVAAWFIYLGVRAL